MFLKSLQIKGFKSFADPATLEFEPGVTVVVGPNGSGKSNVVDAVAWVLGSQSPSTIRSAKMDDVIFAGTSKRPALGRAEVSLTIDNSSGLLPIEFTEVTITRTLFRSGDSEYAINGVPCRLLDIQELLSDTGVGRQQHVIVSQGNLDGVLTARPEDRRLIIEEAAGVLKYRRRREKAQRRLDATEGNLLRLQDLLREVRRSLRPLERQADAARRHGSLVDELSTLRLHLAGRDLMAQRARLQASVDSQKSLAEEESQLRAKLTKLDSEIMSAEVDLTSQGTDTTSDTLVRVETLRQKAHGLRALLAERKRSIDRELEAFLDQELIASLEADAARLASELEQVESEAATLGPRAEEIAAAEAQLAQERASLDAQWGEVSGSPTLSEAAEKRGELAALRSAIEQGLAEVNRIQSRILELEEKEAELVASTDVLRAEFEKTQQESRPIAIELEQASFGATMAREKLSAAEANLRSSEREAHRWQARVDALTMMVDEARARAGADLVTDVDGVVGTLIDLVEIDKGWESAFAASIGQALQAIVVRDADTAKNALERLRSKDIPGLVLSLTAPSMSSSVTIPSGTERVRSHVRSSDKDVNTMLDHLLVNVVATTGDWSSAIDVVDRYPEVIAVTKEGDRFSPTGWTTGGKTDLATAAALEEAKAELKTAQADVEKKQESVSATEESLARADADVSRLRQMLEESDKQSDQASESLRKVEAARREISIEHASVSSHVAELLDRLQREESRVVELEKILPELTAEEAAENERASLLQVARAQLDERTTAIATQRTDLEVSSAGLEERRTFLSRRLSEVEERLVRNSREREEAGMRRRAIEARSNATVYLAEVIEARMITVDTVLARLRHERNQNAARIQSAVEQLDVLRRQRSDSERQLSEVRERLQRVQLEHAEVELRIETLVETIRREFDCEPGVAMATEAPQLAEGVTPAARVRDLERELRLMGPINPLALEEFTQLQERSQFLEAQLDDVKTSRRELSRVIKEIDSEIVEVFASAYADVAEHFSSLFATLFPGGSGSLRLTQPDNLLETGIEIEARPSGKNVRRLSLLSGGERSLTAMGFLFAVFRSRPSPFYLMDEVEAALDDINLHRFLELVREFRDEAQLVIVSHQKRTMEAADCLYGVSMQPGGSSKVVSERLVPAG